MSEQQVFEEEELCVGLEEEEKGEKRSLKVVTKMLLAYKLLK